MSVKVERLLNCGSWRLCEHSDAASGGFRSFVRLSFSVEVPANVESIAWLEESLCASVEEAIYTEEVFGKCTWRWRKRSERKSDSNYFVNCGSWRLPTVTRECSDEFSMLRCFFSVEISESDGEDLEVVESLADVLRDEVNIFLDSIGDDDPQMVRVLRELEYFES